MTKQVSEAEFQQHAEHAIDELERLLGKLAEERDIDVQVEGGVLSVEFDEGEPGKFVVSPNSYTRQLWVSARMSSYKFDWSDECNGFELTGTGEALKQVMTRLIQEQLGDSDVAL